MERMGLDWKGLVLASFSEHIFHGRLIAVLIKSLEFRGHLVGSSGLVHFMLMAQRILFKGVYLRMIFHQAGTVCPMWFTRHGGF
jgi:hypothetical protein